MSRQPIGKHGRDHRPPGTLGPNDPGGHDPIPLSYPNGLLVGNMGVTAAYKNVGSLLWLYRLGEAFTPGGGLSPGVPNACLDTSDYDATPRNMTYKENSPSGSWSTANRPTTGVIDHPSLGTADDGCIKWNYEQGTVGGGGDAGAWLAAGITGLSVFGSGLKTAMGWFKADLSGNSQHGLIYGTYDGVPSGNPFGWGVMYGFGSDQLLVYMDTAGIVATVNGMTRGVWYHTAVVYDSGTDGFTLYLNGVSVATWSAATHYGGSGTTIRVGGGVTRTDTGAYGDFYSGEVDDVAGFSTTLTAAQIQNIYYSSGSSAGQTSVTIPSDGTKYLAGSQPPVFQSVKDSDLSLSDITTNNVSTSRHGLVPKLPNDNTKYLDGTGAFSVPGGGGGALQLLSTTTLLADGTFDVSSISQAYNDLVLILMVRGTRAATAEFLQMRLNNDSAANYDTVNQDSASTGSSFAATSARLSTGMPAASATSGYFSAMTIEIIGYTSTTWKKSGHSISGQPVTAGSSINSEIVGFVWNSTAAVNRVGFFGGTTTNLLTGSQLRIYGRS